MLFLKYLALVLSFAFFLPTYADTSRPDGHAPAGIMGDHSHGAGEWMLSYSYMDMSMDGNRDGTNSISLDDILLPAPGTYMVAPTDMTMRMHMVGVMYAPNDFLTLMLMANFLETDMNHVTAMGGAFETSTSGLGDSSISGIFSLNKTENSDTLLNIGVLLPTGSIDETGVTPASAPNATQLPYPMQTGSGSYAIQPGLTHTYWGDNWSLGAQIKGTFYLDDNDRDYRLGNVLETSVWTARPVSESLSFSARLAWKEWQNIDGADAALMRR